MVTKVKLKPIRWAVNHPDGRYLAVVRQGAGSYWVEGYGLQDHPFDTLAEATEALVTADRIGVTAQ